MKKLLITALIALGALLPSFAIFAQPAYAVDVNCSNPKDCASQGVCATSGDGCPSSSDPGGQVNSLITTVINILSWLVGIISVVMIIIGGLKYVTSQGDSNNVTSAKNTILYAIIGLVVVALAQVIVQFVLAKI